MRLSLFFPAYNEEANIEASVREAERVLAGAQNRGKLSEYEIIVVDDGSRDGTAEKVSVLAAANPRVRLIRHEQNQGYGAALWSGIESARHEWVFFTDADLQFELSEIEELLAHADEYQVVLGYRARRRDPFMRLVNAWGWNVLNRLLFGLTVRDIDCAFKLFERNLIARMPIETRGATMSAEMLIRISRAGVAWKEVPVTHKPRVAGSPTGAKLSVIIRAFRELLGLYLGPLGLSDSIPIQGVKFAVIGVVNTLVDIAAYFIMTRFIPYFFTHILYAKFLTFFFGTITSFFLNRYFTFGMRSRIGAAEIARFYSTIILTVSVNVGMLYVFNTLFGIYDLIAVGLSTIVTFLVGFTISKLWVFRQKPRIFAPKKI